MNNKTLDKNKSKPHHSLDKIKVNQKYQMEKPKIEEKKIDKKSKDNKKPAFKISEDSEKVLSYLLSECEAAKARGEKAYDCKMWLSNDQMNEILKTFQKIDISFSRKKIEESKKHEINKFHLIIIFY